MDFDEGSRDKLLYFCCSSPLKIGQLFIRDIERERERVECNANTVYKK